MWCFRVITFCFVVVFCGCVAKIPQIQHYEVNFNEEVWKQFSIKNPKKIQWEIRVSPKIANYKIAYKTNKNQIAYFSKNAWIEPFSTALKSLAQKASLYAGFLQDHQGEAVLLDFMDCYFDAKSEKVVVNLFVQTSSLSFFITQEEKVQQGEFIRIIEAFEIAINRAFMKAFEGI